MFFQKNNEANSKDNAMQPSKTDQDIIQSSLSRAQIKPYLFLGGILLFGMIFGTTLWSATAQIDGAVIAPAEFAVETKRKKIQHLEGGIVQEIFVKEGDRVEAGQVVLRLNNTVEQANFAVIQNELRQLRAQRIRLLAELQNKARLFYPQEQSGKRLDVRLLQIFEGQKQLFKARLSSQKSEINIREKRIEKLRQEIVGLKKQIASSERQIAFIKDELKSLRKLEQRKLVPRRRMLALEREAERINGEAEALNVSIVRALNSIDEVKLEGIQSKRRFEEQVSAELRLIEPRITQLAEQQTAAQQKLSLIDVRAPFNGFVVDLKANTPGGVIRPGDDIMDIVPSGEKLIIEARVLTMDIDKIKTGQTARVQLTAFDQTVTPEAVGEVLSISADRLKNERTGENYFLARLLLKADQPRAIETLKLVPGMPAMVFIQTGSRTPFSYFLKPLNDRLNRTFKES